MQSPCQSYSTRAIQYMYSQKALRNKVVYYDCCWLGASQSTKRLVRPALSKASPNGPFLPAKLLLSQKREAHNIIYQLLRNTIYRSSTTAEHGIIYLPGVLSFLGTNDRTTYGMTDVQMVRRSTGKRPVFHLCYVSKWTTTFQE